MSIRTLQNDTARIFTISTSHDDMAGRVDTSSLRLSTPVRRYKRSLNAREIAGQDGVVRDYRMIFSSSVTINDTDYIYVQGLKHDLPLTYAPGNGGLNHHIEVDVRQIDGRTS